jgi:hypothetical protein
VPKVLCAVLRLPSFVDAWHPQLASDRELEPRWHHADDDDGFAVQRDRATYDRRVAAEAALPKPVAEDGDLCPTAFVVFRAEGAADERRDAENV